MYSQCTILHRVDYCLTKVGVIPLASLEQTHYSKVDRIVPIEAEFEVRFTELSVLHEYLSTFKVTQENWYITLIRE